MKVDTKSVSFQILTLTDWHRPTLISCRISCDQHQISVRCERYKSVSPTKPSISPSCLFVCSSKPLPPSRGEKTDMEYGYWHWPLLYCLVSTVVSQVLFVWNISKYSIQQARHADPPQQLQTSVDSTLHYQKHYPWVIDLCLTSHIQSLCLGVWVVFGVEEISDFKIIEHSQLTRSD